MRIQLHQAHREKRGLDANKAEEMFITHAQAFADYGSHYYIATMDTKELEKVMGQQKKGAAEKVDRVAGETENIYDVDRSDKSSEYPIYGTIEFSRFDQQPNDNNAPEVYSNIHWPLILFFPQIIDFLSPQ